MPDGFDVRPEQLRQGGADLRADAEGLDDAALGLGAAMDQVAAASGPGPLAGAAAEFSAQLDRAVRAIVASLTDCAGALEASSAQYAATDGEASSALSGPH